VPSKPITGLENLIVLGAGDHLVHQPRVAERERDFGLVDDLGKLACAQHRHGVDHHRARLGRGQPAGDHRRVVGGADQHPVAGLHAVILDQRMGEAVGPVGQFLVGAAATIADQRGRGRRTLGDHRVGQFHRGVEPIGIVEAVQQQVRPHARRAAGCRG
jgi:hypothetical protein